MNIDLLQSELERVHSKLKETAEQFGLHSIMHQAEGKWSPAQNIKHVELSILPVCKLLSNKEKFISRELGTSHTGSRSYIEIMKIYQEGLAGGNVKAPERFVPADLLPESAFILNELDERVDQLIAGLNNFTENELDLYQIPHPLLGQLTIREMIYFYIYHAGHHENNIIRSMKGA